MTSPFLPDFGALAPPAPPAAPILRVPASGADEHSLLSASSAHRWSVCPASLTPDGTRSPAGKAAAEGTLGHYISENMLRGIPAPAVGSQGECAGHVFTIDEAFMRDVNAYVDYIRGRPWVNGYHVEAKVNYSRSLSVPYAAAWGTSDCWGFEANAAAPRGVLLHKIDLKLGRNPVSPTQNPQTTCYCGGVLDSLYPALLLPSDTWVQMTIFQPRLSHAPFSWLTTVGYIESALLALRPPAAAAVAFATSKVTPEIAQAFPETPGGHCQYCPRQRVCTAFKTQVLRAGQTGKTVEWDPKLFAMRKAVTSYLDDLETLALDEALKGTPLPGTKLVLGRAGNAALAMPEAELKSFLQKWGVLDQAFRTVPQWETPAAIRDMLKRVNCPAEQLATVVRAGEKKPTITDADDPRTAYSPVTAASASGFTGIPRI